MTLRDLYLRVSSAIDAAPAHVKAEVDSAFADHEAAAAPGHPAADLPDPAPAPAVDPAGAAT